MATILIVDDLSGNRKFLATLLRDQGHRVLEASNGREGLAAVQAEPLDLVITDVLMPVMDGYEFVRQLDDAIVDGIALWDGLRDRRRQRSVAPGNVTTNVVGNSAHNFNLIANAEAWPRLGLCPSFTRLRARQLVGRRFLRCRPLFMLSALLVATLATLLRMSSRADEGDIGGRGDHAKTAADQLANLFEQTDTARISAARSGSDQSRCISCGRCGECARCPPSPRTAEPPPLPQTDCAGGHRIVGPDNGHRRRLRCAEDGTAVEMALPVTWAVEKLRSALARDRRRAAPVATFLDRIERC